jgi:hypothetical protein
MGCFEQMQTVEGEHSHGMGTKQEEGRHPPRPQPTALSNLEDPQPPGTTDSWELVGTKASSAEQDDRDRDLPSAE